jgi:hypothetical protein
MSKFTKLVKNPKAFFGDAIAKRFPALTPGLSQKPVAAQQKAATPAKPAATASSVKLFTKPADGFYALQGTVPSGDGKLTWDEASPRDKHSSSLVIVNKSRLAAALPLFEIMASYEDFKPFYPDNVAILTFETPLPKNVVDFVNRFDVGSKNQLNKFANLLLIDPAPALIEGLRMAQESARLTTVITPWQGVRAEFTPELADTWIVPEEHPLAAATTARRVLKYSLGPQAEAQIALHLRRVVRDHQPRPLDMLLPVWNGFEYSPDLLEIDTHYAEGVLKLSAPVKTQPASTPFAQMLQAWSPQMAALYLTESVFLRYRSQCEQLREPKDVARLVQTLLYDGVRLDVRS